MIDLNQLRTFAHVAQAGSLTQAARALQKPKSSVSRDLAALERTLSAQLFRRSNRRLNLTEAGLVLLAHARRVLEQAEEAENAVGQLRGKAVGLLRVVTSLSFGQVVLAPLLPRFLEAHPELCVSLRLSSRRSGGDDDADVIIRVGEPEDSSLALRRICTVTSRLYASPAYLERRGRPRSLAELAEHDTVDLLPATGPRAWTAHSGARKATVSVQPRLLANEPATLRVAVTSGFGIGWIPTLILGDDVQAGRLAPVLSSWHSLPIFVYALYSRHREQSPKVRAFVDWLAQPLSRLDGS